MAPFELFQAYPASFVVTGGLLGLIIGSFLNVVIHRLPAMLEGEWRSQCTKLLELPNAESHSVPSFNLVVPRSQCPECGHAIGLFENVPVLSYLWLKGRCAACRHSISLRYPAVELLTAVLTAVVAWHFGFGREAAGAMLLTWALIALSFIDFDHQILPDSITQPFLWLGLTLNLFNTYTSTQASLVGAMAGYLLLWSVYHAFRLITGKEGMGFGDFKLMGMLGAWLGWQLLPMVVLLSSLVGAIVGLALVATQGRDKNLPIPFGPYIACAGWIALLWGNELMAWYLGLATHSFQ